MEKAKEFGISIDGLVEYCANPKTCRYSIASYYKLKDIKTAEGVTITAYEQTKKLPIRLAFGGGIEKWKKDYNVQVKREMPLVSKIITTIQEICVEICKANPHMKEDVEKDQKFNEKNEEEKNRSIMALYAQTWERIIQEDCIAHLVRTYKHIHLRDIVPSQDGFMILKSQAEGIDFKILFATFTEIIKQKYNMTIKWVTKPFDEAIEIPPSSIMPIDIFLEDLNKGERHIASLIAPILRPHMKYYNNGRDKRWYYTNSSNRWCCSTSSNEYMITKVIQDLIEEEKVRKKQGESGR